MLIFLLATIGGAISTFYARVLALRIGIINHPNPLVTHHIKPVANLGGVGILLGIAIALSVVGEFPPLRISLGAIMVLALGLLDDLRPLSPTAKLIAQIAIAIVVVFLGMRMLVFGNAVLDGTLSALVMIILFNAFNFTDVSDGLVAMLSIIGCFGLIILGADSGLALATAGAALGFMIFNKPDASIFLGDAGSHLLGFLAAVLILDPAYGSLQYSPNVWRLLGVFLCFSLPLFELAFLIVVRTYKNIPWYRGSPDHYSLRLQRTGFTKWGVLISSAAVALAMSCGGILLTVLGTALRILILLFVVLIIALLSRVLFRMDGKADD